MCCEGGRSVCGGGVNEEEVEGVVCGGRVTEGGDDEVACSVISRYPPHGPQVPLMVSEP